MSGFFLGARGWLLAQLACLCRCALLCALRRAPRRMPVFIAPNLDGFISRWGSSIDWLDVFSAVHDCVDGVTEYETVIFVVRHDS